jgi:hypothetical protein
MKRYHVTVVPQSSLFLGRDRGNRVVRHSYHYIPASTIGGALNTRFYQVGWKTLTEQVRFGNLYPAAKRGEELVWKPAPRNLYYCPTCRSGHLVESFGPESALTERICSRDGCQTPLQPEIGVVEVRLNGDCFEIHPDKRRSAPPTVNALTVGRTELHRTSAAHVDGRLHQVELLRVRGVPFHGDVWVSDEATDVIQTGASFRLSIGGLRSRGCGRVALHIGDEVTATPNGEETLLVETPLLPLPNSNGEEYPTFHAAIAAPYAQVAVDERWAAKPLRSGKGLVSFLHTLTVDSALISAEGKGVAMDERMYFYRLKGTDLMLYGFDLAACDAHDYNADYTFADLWTLGYGRLRFLSLSDDE